MSINDDTMRLLGEMRAAVDARVDGTTRALTAAWVATWDDLASEWRDAVQDLVAQSVDGRWPSRQTIYRSQRVLLALEATRVALERLAVEAGITITSSLEDLASDAAQWQANLTSTQLPPVGTAGVVLSFNRVDQAALEAIVRRTTEQVTSTLRPLSGEATAQMNAALIRGVALGNNPRQAAREMVRRTESGFNGGLTRALNVARTEMLDAHRAASEAQDKANRDLLTGWMWSASLDRRTCPSCLSMHGQTFGVDEPGPIDHQQGRCARIPVTRSWRDLGFDIDEPPSVFPDAQEWFDAQPAAVQREIMGPARLELLKSGQVSWSDLASKRVSPGWRDSIAPTTVRALTGSVA